MSLKQRATKCSGYIPPNQYVHAYSRPLRTSTSSTVRRYEELSPITPKPTFDDPENVVRSRSIELAVKAWLQSSPNSVIGHVRSRSPMDSPRTSDSSVNRPDCTPPDGELDHVYHGGTAQSTSSQKNKFIPEGSGYDSDFDIDAIHGKSGILRFTDESSPTKETLITQPEGVSAIFSTAEDAAEDEDKASRTDLNSSVGDAQEVPQNQLNLLGSHEDPIKCAVDQSLLDKKKAFDWSRDSFDETRGKEMEDFLAPSYEERKFGDVGMNVVRTAPVHDEVMADGKTVTEKTHIKPVFDTSTGTTYKSDQVVDVGTTRVRLGEILAESRALTEQTNIKSVIFSTPAKTTHESDQGVVSKRHSKSCERTPRRNQQPLYEIDGSPAPAHRHMVTRQVEPYESQTRPAKRDGRRKTAVVVPRSGDSEFKHYSPRGVVVATSTSHEGVVSSRTPLKKQPSSKQLSLERVNDERFLSKAAAWEESKNSECFSRYEQEETKITAWEEHKKVKAAINLKKVELKLLEKKAKAMEKIQNEMTKAHKKAEEKMQNEMAKAHRKAEEKKASAEAKRAEKAAKAAEEAESIRQYGRRRLSLFCFS